MAEKPTVAAWANIFRGEKNPKRTSEEPKEPQKNLKNPSSGRQQTDASTVQGIKNKHFGRNLEDKKDV